MGCSGPAVQDKEVARYVSLSRHLCSSAHSGPYNGTGIPRANCDPEADDLPPPAPLNAAPAVSSCLPPSRPAPGPPSRPARAPSSPSPPFARRSVLRTLRASSLRRAGALGSTRLAAGPHSRTVLSSEPETRQTGSRGLHATVLMVPARGAGGGATNVRRAAGRGGGCCQRGARVRVRVRVQVRVRVRVDNGMDS